MRYPIQGVLTNAAGDVVDNAILTVYVADTLNPATIYAGKVGGSPISGAQITTDENGRWIFYNDDAVYPFIALFDLKFEKAGFTTTWFYDVWS